MTQYIRPAGDAATPISTNSATRPGKESKWICLHRSALYEEISPVTGELISGQISCKVARTIGECRTEGRYWTPRDDPPVGFV